MMDYNNNRISNIPIYNQHYINQNQNQNQNQNHNQNRYQMQQSQMQPHQPYPPPPPPPHKYSPQYANYIGAQPRATASANARIRLGGVF